MSRQVPFCDGPIHALPGRTKFRVGNQRRCRAQHGALRLVFRRVHFTFSAYSITDRTWRITIFDKGLWHSGNSGTGFRPTSHASCGEFRRTAARPSAQCAGSPGLQADETGVPHLAKSFDPRPRHSSKGQDDVHQNVLDGSNQQRSRTVLPQVWRPRPGPSAGSDARGCQTCGKRRLETGHNNSDEFSPTFGT